MSALSTAAVELLAGEPVETAQQEGGDAVRRVSSRFDVVWEPTTLGPLRIAGRDQVHGLDHAAHYAVALGHALAEAGSPARRLSVSITTESEETTGEWAVQTIKLAVEGDVPGVDERELELFARLAISGCRLWDTLPSQARIDLRTSLVVPYGTAMGLAGATAGEAAVPPARSPLILASAPPAQDDPPSRAGLTEVAPLPRRTIPGGLLAVIVGAALLAGTAAGAWRAREAGAELAAWVFEVPSVELAWPAFLLGLASSAPADTTGPDFCRPGEVPGFVLGFAELRAVVGTAMGEAVECEHRQAGGVTVQATTTGLAVYEPATGRVSFTDGWQSWALGE